MPKITVLDTEVEVTEEILFLLETEAEEYNWNFKPFINFILGGKWRAHLKDGADTVFTLGDVLRIDARDVACNYWTKMEKKGEAKLLPRPLGNEELRCG